MAVIISNGATNLSTASGFYRVESYNLSSFSPTTNALTSARQIAVTFANAGNCQGVVLAIMSSVTVNRDITVKLQENTGSWTDRASVTLTASQISAGASSTASTTFFVPFEFATPYAVDTASNKWRFDVSQGSGSSNWYLGNSNGTAFMYATWCDNAVSYTTNDVVIAKEKVTIDQDCTFAGLTSTGDTANAVCAIACRPATYTVGSEAMFEWQNTPSASYTMQIQGWFVLSSRSGFRAGTEASPIPIAKQAIIKIQNATASSTVSNSGFSASAGPASAGFLGRYSIDLWGEVPTYQRTTLASDANSGQKDIVTTDTTGWAIGDRIFITKSDAVAVLPETSAYTISAISGTNITVDYNIPTYKKLAGGHVVRLNGYGIYLVTETTSLNIQYLPAPTSFMISGCQIHLSRFTTQSGTSINYEDVSNIRQDIVVSDCSYGSLGSTSSSLFNQASYFHPQGKILLQRVNFFKCGTWSTIYGNTWRITECVLAGTNSGAPLPSFTGNRKVSIDNCWFTNNYYAIQFGGLIDSDIYDNIFWGNIWTIRNNGAMVNTEWHDNVYDRTNTFWYAFGITMNTRFVNESYGVNATISTFYLYYVFNSGIDDMTIIDATVGTVTTMMDATMRTGIDGTKIRFQNWDSANVDMTYMPYGDITRTGTGLADTTVRTAGGYAMKFTPASSTELMHWEQNIPIGDIQTKTMTVTCWVKINNSAYYAGTHTKPTLTVTYDQTTTITSTALGNTGWQQLACTFTPTTDFGQIQIKLTANTDATGTNRDFYVDDFNIAYPAGVAVNLGGLDLWADGLPVAPAIATVPSLGGVWDEALTAHTVAGSMGELLADAADSAELASIR